MNQTAEMDRTLTAQDAVEILLVEDNSDDAELAFHALKRNKLANRIHRVFDGAEALDFLFSEGAYSVRAGSCLPKIVLLDLKLPKVDGLEVLKRIKGDPRTRNVPVTVLTSSREECDVIASYSLGANSFIVKPVDFEQFTDTVKQLGMYWLVLNQNPVE